jgi:ribonucleoside-diphosphate reductase alpha chain
MPAVALSEAAQVSVEPTKVYSAEEAVACSLDNPDACEACGS